MLKDKKVVVNMPRRRRCELDSTTKQSVLPIQVTPVVEREVKVAGRKRHPKSKQLYTYSGDGGIISITFQINEYTGHSGIYTSFLDGKNIQRNKKLYSIGQEGCITKVACVVNLKTGHIGISTSFGVQRHWNGGSATNPNCSLYLGVVIAEQILSNVFKNVERTPPNNPGYDFICSKGLKIDVKSSCNLKYHPNNWAFTIKRNQEADYFLCIAFDNRKDLNPQHVWLIPASGVNHLVGASISISTLDKWAEYELTDKLDDVISCCDTMKKLDD